VWKMRFRNGTFDGLLLSSDSPRRRTVAELLALLLLTASFLGEGYGGRGPSDREAGGLAAETDALGREVCVREYPRRIISTAPSNTEILLSLGLRDKLVGVTSFYGRPEKVKGITRIGGYINPNVAKIISLHPDLVFAARGNSRDVIQQLRRHGIKTFTLDTKTVSGLLADVRKVGALTGTGERAKRLTSAMEREIRDIRQKVAKLSDGGKPRVFWIGQEEPLRTAGPGSLVDELIELAGGRNIAGDGRMPWPSYNMEKLLLRNPEVIILSEDKYKSSQGKVARTIARFRRDRVWGKVSAVKEGRVHFIPADLLGQPSPLCMEGLKLLAKRLHPDLFAEHAEKKTREDTEKRSD